jgi:LruC domain-containing protein
MSNAARASMGSRLFGVLASLAALAPAAALAQDADGDGVPNASDAFPCDASRASVDYYPSSSSSALLAFEDQWPGSTDLDFNDVVVRVHYRLERNAAGNVVSLDAVFDPVALGGDLSNGLGLQLPTSRAGVTAQRRVGGSGSWTSVSLESDANTTLLLSQNLRELFGNGSGRINSVGGQTRQTGQRLELRLDFATPAALSTSAAPFDVFIFRTGTPGHQIHLPTYFGTSAMNTALFNSGQDRSVMGVRAFVHLSGIPAALNLSTSTRYPLEGVAVSALFPDIIGFASSGGSSNTSFFSTNVVSAQGHDVAALALPAVASPSSSCVSVQIPVVSYSMLNGETGSFTYWDDAYSGSGSRTTSLSPLSGGLGELTDGVVATSNWMFTPGPYVGWENVVPDITFDFGSVQTVDAIDLSIDDPNQTGAGGVAPPSSVEITIGGVTVTRSVVDPAAGVPYTLTLSGLGLTGSSARIRLFDGVATWVFVSEVRFRRGGAAVIVTNGVSRRWSDGTFAVGCWQYRNPPTGYVYAGQTGDGRYTIQPGATPFDVYCDMTTDGGGYTLVDNDATTTDVFASRQAGANPDPTVTRGSYLPAYQWSATPRLLCKSSVFTGTVGWVTLTPIGSIALEYPTATTTTHSYGGTPGHWAVDQLNGNTNQGTASWIFNEGSRFGSVWIGNGGQPTCACDYDYSYSGLGAYAHGNASTCSTWVR